MKMVKNRRLVFTLMVLLTITMPGCQKGDADSDFGFAYIYIPQATVSNGLNNYYPVPKGDGIDTYNFRKENGKLNIILGILRSGKISGAAGFTVDVVVSSTMAEEAVASSEIPNALVLPSNLYVVPDKVTVESGKDNAAFYLSVDIDALMDGTYDGKNLVLALEIDKPTNYQLSDENTSVVVIIDVDAMRNILFSTP